MKCIKNEKGDIKRVNDDIANDIVSNGEWSYVSKSQWKEKIKNKSKDKK